MEHHYQPLASDAPPPDYEAGIELGLVQSGPSSASKSSPEVRVQDSRERAVLALQSGGGVTDTQTGTSHDTAPTAARITRLESGASSRLMDEEAGGLSGTDVFTSSDLDARQRQQLRRNDRSFLTEIEATLNALHPSEALAKPFRALIAAHKGLSERDRLQREYFQTVIDDYEEDRRSNECVGRATSALALVGAVTTIGLLIFGTYPASDRHDVAKSGSGNGTNVPILSLKISNITGGDPQTGDTEHPTLTVTLTPTHEEFTSNDGTQEEGSAGKKKIALIAVDPDQMAALSETLGRSGWTFEDLSAILGAPSSLPAAPDE